MKKIRLHPYRIIFLFKNVVFKELRNEDIFCIDFDIDCFMLFRLKSVPKLAAKPVIDIDIIVENKEKSESVIQSLERIGFKHRGDLGIEGREAFTQLPKFPKHNLYVCLDGCLALQNHLNLRDYLMRNPDAVQQYSKLKRELALETKDMGKYIEGKTEFITSILSKTGISQDSIKSIQYVNKAD